MTDSVIKDGKGSAEQARQEPEGGDGSQVSQDDCRKTEEDFFQTKEAQPRLKAARAHGKLSCRLHVSGRPKLDLTLFRASRRNNLGKIEYFQG